MSYFGHTDRNLGTVRHLHSLSRERERATYLSSITYFRHILSKSGVRDRRTKLIQKKRKHEKDNLMVCAVSDDEHSAMRRVTHFASLAEICCILYVNTGWRCLSSRFICHAALLASFMRQKHFTSRWPVTHYSGHCWSCHHCSEHNSECNWHSRSWCDCDHRRNFCIDYCAAS